MEKILSSYKGSELRKMCVDHNKQLKKLTKTYTKESRDVVLEENGIETIGVKKAGLIESMLGKEQFFSHIEKKIKKKEVKVEED
tara:strand:+ start:246 stop:497 length:252 start_codon:yes stop_codon:yes gene_type:complete